MIHSITQREAEAKETWREMDEIRQQAFREGPFSKLPFGGGDLVRTAERVIKVQRSLVFHVWSYH